jgi:hypothetical protein
MRNLPKRLTPEKTSTINTDGKVIAISTLPLELQEEFLIVDEIKIEAAELSYRLEVLTLALATKSQQLGMAVFAHLAGIDTKNVQQAEQTTQQELVFPAAINRMPQA